MRLDVWFILMGLLALSSCAVQIKNERVYGNLDDGSAYWFETLTPLEGAIAKADWDKLRVGMACMSIDSFGDYKAEIEKLCSHTKCNYEKVQQALGEFERHMAAFRSQLK